MDRWFRGRPGRPDADLTAIRELLGPLDPAAGRTASTPPPPPLPEHARGPARRRGGRRARLAVVSLAGVFAVAGATATAIAGLEEERPSDLMYIRCFVQERVDPDRPVEAQFVAMYDGGPTDDAARAIEMCDETRRAEIGPFAGAGTAPEGRVVCVMDGYASVFPVRPGGTCASLGLPQMVRS